MVIFLNNTLIIFTVVRNYFQMPLISCSYFSFHKVKKWSKATYTDPFIKSAFMKPYIKSLTPSSPLFHQENLLWQHCPLCALASLMILFYRFLFYGFPHHAFTFLESVKLLSVNLAISASFFSFFLTAFWLAEGYLLARCISLIFSSHFKLLIIFTLLGCLYKLYIIYIVFYFHTTLT